VKVRYEIVPATHAHAVELAATMRRADVEELAALGYAPLPAIEVSMVTSRDVWAGKADGRVMCIFGVSTATVLSDEAFPWLLTAQDMPRHAKIFLRLNRDYIAAIKTQYRLLWGLVCETNTTSIRWLSWLGFSVEPEAIRLTPGKPGFHRFRLENSACPS
jgi:hypothetical protein